MQRSIDLYILGFLIGILDSGEREVRQRRINESNNLSKYKWIDEYGVQSKFFSYRPGSPYSIIILRTQTGQLGRGKAWHVSRLGMAPAVNFSVTTTSTLLSPFLELHVVSESVAHQSPVLDLRRKEMR